MTIFCIQRWSLFQNIILLKCYTFLLLLVILNEIPAHVIQMKGFQLQVMQFSISLKWEKTSSYQIELKKYCFSFVTLDCYQAQKQNPFKNNVINHVCHETQNPKNFVTDYQISLQINGSLEAAAQLNWASGSSSTAFQVGCKYDVDKDTSVRVRHHGVFCCLNPVINSS